MGVSQAAKLSVPSIQEANLLHRECGLRSDVPPIEAKIRVGRSKESRNCHLKKRESEGR